jgi:ATP synthase protein I
MLGVTSRPIRTALGWQALASLVAAGLGGWLAGAHGAYSAALGGGIGVLGSLAFAWVASRSRGDSAETLLFGALRAEALKVAVLLALLGVVFASYPNVVAVALVGSFIVSTIVFTLAAFVRDA